MKIVPNFLKKKKDDDGGYVPPGMEQLQATQSAKEIGGDAAENDPKDEEPPLQEMDHGVADEKAMKRSGALKEGVEQICKKAISREDMLKSRRRQQSRSSRSRDAKRSPRRRGASRSRSKSRTRSKSQTRCKSKERGIPVPEKDDKLNSSLRSLFTADEIVVCKEDNEDDDLDSSLESMIVDGDSNLDDAMKDANTTEAGNISPKRSFISAKHSSFSSINSDLSGKAHRQSLQRTTNSRSNDSRGRRLSRENSAGSFGGERRSRRMPKGGSKESLNHLLNQLPGRNELGPSGNSSKNAEFILTIPSSDVAEKNDLRGRLLSRRGSKEQLIGRSHHSTGSLQNSLRSAEITTPGIKNIEFASVLSNNCQSPIATRAGMRSRRMPRKGSKEDLLSNSNHSVGRRMRRNGSKEELSGDLSGPAKSIGSSNAEFGGDLSRSDSANSLTRGVQSRRRAARNQLSLSAHGSTGSLMDQDYSIKIGGPSNKNSDYETTLNDSAEFNTEGIEKSLKKLPSSRQLSSSLMASLKGDLTAKPSCAASQVSSMVHKSSKKSNYSQFQHKSEGFLDEAALKGGNSLLDNTAEPTTKNATFSKRPNLKSAFKRAGSVSGSLNASMSAFDVGASEVNSRHRFLLDDDEGSDVEENNDEADSMLKLGHSSLSNVIFEVKRKLTKEEKRSLLSDEKFKAARRSSSNRIIRRVASNEKLVDKADLVSLQPPSLAGKGRRSSLHKGTSKLTNSVGNMLQSVKDNVKIREASKFEAY